MFLFLLSLYMFICIMILCILMLKIFTVIASSVAESRIFGQVCEGKKCVSPELQHVILYDTPSAGLQLSGQQHDHMITQIHQLPKA